MFPIFEYRMVCQPDQWIHALSIDSMFSYSDVSIVSILGGMSAWKVESCIEYWVSFVNIHFINMLSIQSVIYILSDEQILLEIQYWVADKLIRAFQWFNIGLESQLYCQIGIIRRTSAGTSSSAYCHCIISNGIGYWNWMGSDEDSFMPVLAHTTSQTPAIFWMLGDQSIGALAHCSSALLWLVWLPMLFINSHIYFVVPVCTVPHPAFSTFKGAF